MNTIIVTMKLICVMTYFYCDWDSNNKIINGDI